LRPRRADKADGGEVLPPICQQIVFCAKENEKSKDVDAPHAQGIVDFS
jgi:hypothetical protein